MWEAWVVAAVALAGVAFMLGFLIALLREGAPSVCYWAVPVRREWNKKGHHRDMRDIYFDEECRATESGRGDCRLELVENESHATQCASGLIALDVRPASASLGWRSIRKGVHDLRERRI